MWLSDFGIAKQLFGEEALKTGNVAGTPQYMAPEQLRGKPEEASDIYALGVTAYYLFTRRMPFTGSANEVMIKQVTEMPVGLVQAVQNLSNQEINPKIAAALDPIIMKALAKDPDKRYASVSLFTETLVDAYDSASGEKTGQSGISSDKS